MAVKIYIKQYINLIQIKKKNLKTGNRTKAPLGQKPLNNDEMMKSKMFFFILMVILDILKYKGKKIKN
jgi:hypothetical protein